MAIGLEDKKQIVSEVNQAASSALSAVLADYHGVDVDELTALRKTARENKVYLRVVRNTLLKRALEDTEFECIQEVLKGPTLLALSQEDPGAAARVLKISRRRMMILRLRHSPLVASYCKQVRSTYWRNFQHLIRRDLC